VRWAEVSADPMARLQRLRRSQTAGDDQVAGLKRAAMRGELPGQPDQPGGRMTARRGTDRAFHDLPIH
jgi:hypothetical protein